MLTRSLLTLATGAMLVCQAVAQRASINLNCFPGISVADGHSSVTVTAEVRDSGGSFVRNGTPVVFETDKGSFRGKTVVETQNGFARIVLTAPGLPGTAKVRANVFSLNASAVIEIDFVNDRSILDSTKEFVELTSSGTLEYATQDKVVTMEGESQGAVLRYRDVEIRAEQLQLRVPSFEVRARGAKVTVGKSSAVFREFSMKLNQRRGVGLTTSTKKTPSVTPAGIGVVVELVESTELVAQDFSQDGAAPHEGQANMAAFAFWDTSKALSTVQAKKATVNPGRSVQFQKASVRLGGQSVMSLPLFQVDLNSSSPVVTQQFLDVSNSSLALNYPYYLSLRPGETSLMRLRYGNRYSSGLGATGGTYLDYEYNWNRGPNMDGGVALTGLARDDWGAGLRQYWQPDSNSSVSAQLDLPAHRSLFANLGYSRQFAGFQTSLSAQHGRSVAGDRFQNDQLVFGIDSDPIGLGKLPAHFSVGLTAQSRRFTGTVSESQQSYGLQARVDSQPLALDSRDTVTLSYSAARLTGTNITSPFTQLASLNLASNWFPGLFLQTTYEFGQDGFAEDVLGRHRLTLDGTYNSGRFNARTFLSKGLDIDRLSATFDLNYRFDSLWRLSTGYLIDRYAGDTFLEQTVVLGYRLGFREIGLSYSTRTKRLGLELLGTRFN